MKNQEFSIIEMSIFVYIIIIIIIIEMSILNSLNKNTVYNTSQGHTGPRFVLFGANWT